MNLITIFQQHDQTKYPNSFFYFKKFLQFIEMPNRVIIVDNSKDMFDEYAYKNVTVLKSNDDLWDFGAWQHGIDYVHQNNLSYDAILFVNESHSAPGHNLLQNICTDDSVIKAIHSNDILGAKVNSYCNDVRIKDYIIKDFIRTNCFILSKKMIRELVTIWSVDHSFLDLCISPGKTFPYFKDDAPLCDNLKKGFIYCLTKDWHSKFILYNDWDLFRMKSLALMNEYLLSARVKEVLNNDKFKSTIPSI